ncbi:uncharacterized protein LOC120005964 [Tripterygium wilfordii]|uniref:uncharacterized protein LOC120005964 n=1 Tax=Tripterygium wilfordii TaxID=458696 RepID=UPI0018F83586|nr:uncharacterized protein LOC120005964 [Tripterygium wilfordii]
MSQMTKVRQALTTNEKGKFIAQPYPNPSKQTNLINSSSGHGEVNGHEQVQYILTLRNGKVVDRPIPFENSDENDRVKKQRAQVEESERQPSEEKVAPSKESEDIPKLPFPQRLRKSTNEALPKKMFELFRQVKINIPLLDAIKKIPSYVKFLKDLCTVKMKLNVKEKVFLTEQASSIIQTNTLPKYKDPGELKPIRITLQLADRSVKVPRGIVEDVSGVLQFCFGNMAMEMNIFNMTKFMGECEDIREVDFIHAYVKDSLESTLAKDPVEGVLALGVKENGPLDVCHVPQHGSSDFEDTSGRNVFKVND